MSKKKQTCDYQWRNVKTFHGGHRIFRDEHSGKYSVCDGSGSYPHLTEDGVLWIDTDRPVTCQVKTEVFGLPVTTEDGVKKATVVPAEEARWAVETFRMSIKVGDDLFDRPNFPPIPIKTGVGDVSTHHITLRDSLSLARGDVPFQAGNFEYGHIVLTHPKEDTRKDHELRSIGMSEAYIRLLHLAYAQGYYYLMIDRDGPDIEGLDKFNW